LLQSANAFK